MDASTSVEVPETATPLDALTPRGRELWDALGQSLGTPSGELALEACRTRDRLDDLDAVIHGKGVLNLLTFRLDLDFSDDESRQVNVKVEFSGVLAEARQQQSTLRQTLVSLGMKPGAPAAKPKGSPLDELKAKRDARGGAGPADADGPQTTRQRTAARRRR